MNLTVFIFHEAARPDLPVPLTFRGRSPQQDARSGRQTCGGAVFRNQRSPEGKMRRGEGHRRHTIRRAAEERKPTLAFFESRECCQNRSRSSCCFVKSHRLPVQTSVSVGQVNPAVTHAHAHRFCLLHFSLILLKLLLLCWTALCCCRR